MISTKHKKLHDERKKKVRKKRQTAARSHANKGYMKAILNGKGLEPHNNKTRNI